MWASFCLEGLIGEAVEAAGGIDTDGGRFNSVAVVLIARERCLWPYVVVIVVVVTRVHSLVLRVCRELFSAGLELSNTCVVIPLSFCGSARDST